jgi:hypothetical protein
VKNADGTWSWSYATTDGPEQSQTVTITATDSDNATTSTTFQLTVNNVAPTLAISGAATVDEGSTYTLNLDSQDPGADTITSWTISWGDGSVETISGDPASASHTYVDGPNSYTITATATDEDGTYASNSLTVAVNNVAPSVAANQAGVTIDEGQTATNTGTWSDPGADDVTLTASKGTIVKNANGTWSWSFASTDGPNDSATVTITATDSDGAVTTTTFSLVVNNVAPTATDNGYSTAHGTLVTGNVITDGTPDSDPAGTFDPLTIVGHTPPANGTLTINADGTFTYQPFSTFSGSDTFTYTISDGDGGTDTATVTITVAAPAPGTIITAPDTCIGGTALIITGTSGADHIVVNPGASGDTLKISINGVDYVVTRPSGRIIVIGGAGDDNIQIAGSVTNTVWAYGEAGNDRIYGGGGPSLLIGGTGNDQLTGGSGRDVMIGGNGADSMIGNSGDDILVAGITTYDERTPA